MKKKKGVSLSQKVVHFFKHYFVLLLIALGCALLTVMLIAYAA